MGQIQYLVYILHGKIHFLEYTCILAKVHNILNGDMLSAFH